MLLLTRIGQDTSYWTHVLPSEILLSIGMADVFIPASNTALVGVGNHDAGVASAVLNTSQQIGGSLGTALLNTVFAGAVTGYLDRQRPHRCRPSRASRGSAGASRASASASSRTSSTTSPSPPRSVQPSSRRSASSRGSVPVSTGGRRVRAAGGGVLRLVMLPEAAEVHLRWLRARLRRLQARRARAPPRRPAPPGLGADHRAAGPAGPDEARARPLFERFDVLVAPQMPVVAPRIGEDTVAVGGQMVPYRTR